MRRLERVTLVLLLIAPLSAAQLETNYPSVQPSYERFRWLLDGYRTWDDRRMRELGDLLIDKELRHRDFIDGLIRGTPLQLAPLAQMALSDLAIDALSRDDKNIANGHLQTAQRWIDANLQRPGDEPLMQRQRTFAHDWYHAVIWLRQARSEDPETESLLDKAREKFPDDPEVFLSSGTHEEINLTHRRREKRNSAHAVMRPGEPSYDNALGLSRFRQREERAIGYFRTAIRLDPNNAEARIRLAHLLVWIQSLRFDEELTLLREAHILEPKPPLSYLAALFAGDVEEQLKHFDNAATWYRTAVATCPRAQTARLALSHVQLVQGPGMVGAQNALRPLLGGPPAEDRVCEPDPWRMYDMGQAWRLDDLIQTMRRYVREPVEGSQL
jgi:tetratricopeptide (TPR) repeat protein